jgi:uncharacterized HhH-GPD family protein
MQGDLFITGDPDADKLLNTDPLALLLGMLLDQQVPMEWAFGAPLKLRARLDGQLDADAIAGMDPEAFALIMKGPPALHRFPGSMGKRVQELCRHLVDNYGGDAAAVWATATSGDELFAHLKALPGFGAEKAKIFTALLAKRVGVTPEGWEEVAAPFSDTTPRSVADIDSPETLARVREWKQMRKKEGKTKSD